VPTGILAGSIYRWRPRWWAWAGLGLVALWPRTVGAVLFGNTDMWMAALVAGGLLWGWPAVLVSIKSTLMPLAFLGLHRRSWRLAAGGLVALLLVTLPFWLQYVRVLRDVRGLGLDYSLGSAPFVFAPLVAWLGRSRRAPRR
jgi:hypothetical protein